jgi:hypothetical protein
VRAFSRRRRKGSERDPGNVMFGTIGWLFADLMLALALAFIVATTVGQPLPAATKTPTVTPSPTPTPSTTKANEPALELTPVEINLGIDPQLLLANDPNTVGVLWQQIQSDPRLAGRRAGLVEIFGGANDKEDSDRGMRIADTVKGVLSGFGAGGSLFGGSVYVSFINLKGPEVLSLHIYLFKLSS